MSAIPPNNLDHLIAWIRLFAEDISSKIQEIQRTLKALQDRSKEEK